MKVEVDQGDILKIEKINVPVLVTSKDIFNRSGQIIGCPVIKDGIDGPTHIHIHVGTDSSCAHCEKLSLLDLDVRRYKKIGSLSMAEKITVSDTIQSLFEYI